MNIKVSAVVPTHNHSWCIGDALNSLLQQNYPLTSIVIVDDGSTDGTANRLISDYRMRQTGPMVYEGQVFAEDGHQCLLKLQVNERATGPGQARNAGATLSKVFGPHLFAFLDSDDVYSPDKVLKSVQVYLTAPQAIGVIYSDYETLNEAGLRTREYKEPYSQARLFQECIVNCDSLVSAEAFEWAGGFPDIRTCEDYSLWLKLSKRYLAYHIPEALVTIRVGSHSSSATVPQETWNKCYRQAFELAGLTP